MRIGLGIGLARRGVSQFSPASLPGLVGWWRADKLITLDGSSNVQSWGDLSGNGLALTQATSTSRPAYNTTDAKFNGKPSVVVASGKDLAGTLATLSQPLTILMVAYMTAAGNIFDGTTANRVAIGKNASGYYMYASIAVNIASGVADANAHALAFVANNTSSQFMVDASNNPTTGNPGATGLQNPGIGGNFPGTGATAEAILCSGSLSATNIGKTFSYFASLYGGAWA